MLHVASFDVVKSYALRLINVSRNESQHGNTEFHSTFFYFKSQTCKHSRFFNSLVLTINDIVNAMECAKGTSNSRFEIAQLDMPHLDTFRDKFSHHCALTKNIEVSSPAACGTDYNYF